MACSPSTQTASGSSWAWRVALGRSLQCLTVIDNAKRVIIPHAQQLALMAVTAPKIRSYSATDEECD